MPPAEQPMSYQWYYKTREGVIEQAQYAVLSQKKSNNYYQPLLFQIILLRST